MILVKKSKRNKIIIIWIIGICLFLFSLLMLFIPIPHDSDWDYSKVILAEDSSYLRVNLNNSSQWHLEYKERIPGKLKIAVMQYEDKYFNYHLGINPISIIKAFFINLRNKKVVSGGSTLTMQTARLYLNKDRTLFNKAYEALIALKLELTKSKDEIMCMYLNNAPYGSNIVGIKTASYKYYAKDVTDLTWAEACLFAVLPNNPGYIYPGKNTAKLKHKRDNLLIRLNNKGIISNTQLSNSLREMIPSNQYQFPIISPHLSDRLFSFKDNEITTTICKKTQIKLEKLARYEGQLLKKKGIKNLAILVSETQTGHVKAYLGSQNYLDFQTNGFVDGIKASRSSGSILKPFIYSYAFEKGKITPNSLLEDVPHTYGTFLPKNFDKKYRGLVTAREALQKSLNIPAYEITKDLGIYDVVSLLKNLGMKSLTREANDYGLSICIGGAETNLWELSEMYQTLANKGVYKNLKVIKNEKSETRETLLSPASAYMALEILQGVEKPNKYKNKFSNIAWKTGTSNGFRDSWAVGVSPEWTIAVWSGNFTGEGNPHLTGRQVSGEILFKVFDLLVDSNNNFAKPWSSFKYIPLCSESGLSPTKYCQDTILVEVPKEVDVLAKCKYHKQIVVDEAETMQVCSSCWNGLETELLTVIDYPPVVDFYLQKEGRILPPIPPHNPKCHKINASSLLDIKYPINNSTIYLPIDLSGEVKTFQARVYTSDTEVYWFLNKEMIAKTLQKHEIDIQTNPGEKTLLLITSEGESKHIKFTVRIKED